MVRVLQERYGLRRETKRRTRNMRPRPPRPESRTGRRSPGDESRLEFANRLTSDVAVGERAVADGIFADRRLDDDLRRPSTVTSKCEPSFQRALIGSLICSSMKRFRKRAPNAML